MCVVVFAYLGLAIYVGIKTKTVPDIPVGAEVDNPTIWGE
jgi:hypothetical protein